MVTVLLIIIYIAFIGLGVPDSLFGSAWPAMYEEFGLPFAFGGFITAIMSAGTVTSSMFSAWLIKRMGTGKITMLSTLITAVSIALMAVSGNFWLICACALPLGLGAGAIDTGLNNYVSQHYNASQMSFLHCFYGIGITLSPFLLARAMAANNGWEGGYWLAVWIQAGITLLLIVSLPLWNRVFRDSVVDGSDANTRVMSLREIIGTPGVKPMWLMFFASVAIEMSCGGWACTYLVENKGLTPQAGAELITFYFLGIAVGRFLSGVLAVRLRVNTIIRIGLVVLGAALVLLLLAPGTTVAVVALFLIALGNSPMFPNFTYITPARFGNEQAASIMGTQFAVANTSYMIMPIVCSLIGQWLGMWIFPWFLLIMYALLIAGIVRFRLEQ